MAEKENQENTAPVLDMMESDVSALSDSDGEPEVINNGDISDYSDSEDSVAGSTTSSIDYNATVSVLFLLFYV